MSKTAITALVVLLVVSVGAAALLARWKQNVGDEPERPVADDTSGSAAGSGSGSGAEVADAPLAQLAILNRCPDFRLVDLLRCMYVEKDDLMGQPWIANFVTASDAEGGRESMQRLLELQNELRQTKMGNDVRIASIIVDAADMTTAGQAMKFAQDNGAAADGSMWLTGNDAEVRQLCVEGLGVPLEQDEQGKVKPVMQFVLVDPQGDVRATYDCRSANCLAAIMHDLHITFDERVLMLDNRIDPPGLVGALINPPWLEKRIAAQIETIGKFKVFHDFSFSDRVKESGIRFRHRIVDDAGRWLITAHYDHGNGIAAADVDGDERLDIYFVNQVGGSELWRNLGDGTFENITATAGVALTDRIGVTASFADIDNDGDADLYVTTVRGGNALFENDGQGKFTDISKAAGVGYIGHSSSAEFFDYDRDGLLDLFLVNVGIYTTEKVATVQKDRFTGPDERDYTYYVSNPDAFAAHLKPARTERSILFRNLGGNRFEDVSEKVELVDKNWTGDATPLDANVDGWPDLYLVNMQGHNEYYENVEGKKFVRKSRELFPATPWGAMGIKSFDFNNDGHMDIYVTDMHTDMAKELAPTNEKEKIPKDAMDPMLLGTDGNHVMGNAFYLNNGQGQFQEVSDTIGAENYWPWGLSVADLNADGFDDAFLTSSMSFPFRYAVNSLLLNNQGHEFLDSEFILGVEPRRSRRTAIPWFELDMQEKDQKHPITKLIQSRGRHVARAVVWGAVGSRSSVIFDLEGDGDLDIVTNDFNSRPMVLVSNLSESKKPLQFLQVKLVGHKSNHDGLGATVRVQSGTDTYTKVYDGQSGYLSQSRCPLYFGLGEHETIEQIEVRWPSGAVQTVAGPVSTNQTLVIEERL